MPLCVDVSVVAQPSVYCKCLNNKLGRRAPEDACLSPIYLVAYVFKPVPVYWLPRYIMEDLFFDNVTGLRLGV